VIDEHGDPWRAAAALGLTQGVAERMPLARPRCGRVVVCEAPVWAVPLRAALSPLLALPLRDEEAPAWRQVPASAVVWALAARLAVRLVSAHRLAPTLYRDAEGRAHGVWRALVDNDAEAGGLLSRLAAAMPRAAHALPLGDGAVWDPRLLLRAMLDAVADLAAREGGPPPTSRPRARLLPWTARWAEALADPADSVVPLREDVAELVAGISGWHAGGSEDGGAGVIELRLVAPDTQDGKWRLGFGVRTPDGELHPAAQVWALRGGDPNAAALQKTLLRGLGRCARVFAPIDASLREAAPDHLDLDIDQAWELLSEAAAVLSAAGVVVQLPGDLIQHRLRPRIRVGMPVTDIRDATDSPPIGGGDVEPPALDEPDVGLPPDSGAGARHGGLAGLLADFRWEIALGDETLPAEEFEALVAAQRPLVRWRDRWVRVDPAVVERVRRLGNAGKVPLAEALALALEGDAASEWYTDDPDLTRAEASGDVLTDAGDEPIEVVADSGLTLLLDRIRAACDHPPAPKTPEGFEGELRGYQRRGVAWLAGMGQLGLGAVLADDMGLGKCVAPDTRIFVNGGLARADRLWERFAGVPSSDKTGEWAEPTEVLVTNALSTDERIISARIERLYRQRVREPLRRVVLGDGSALTLTRCHKLRGWDGWTSEIRPGDRVAVPGRIRWGGAPCGDARLLDACGSAGGRIPGWVIAADEACARRFVRAWMSARGTVGAGGREIHVSVDPAQRLALALILRRFGVWLRGGVISGASLDRYRRCIGFDDAHKQAQLDAVSRAPVAVMALARLGGGSLGGAVGERTPEVFWERVEAVEEVDYEGWVYDFEVPEHHSFVAEGVLCHNTIQLIAHLLERPASGAGSAVGPFLIVCPTSVVGNWEREVRRFAPGMPVMRHHGAERSRALSELGGLDGLDGAVLTTYGTLRRDADLLAGISWDVVALDEAQYVKNPTTAAARAVRRLQARQVVALTGTPLENRLAELWSVLDATNPGLLGTRGSFGRRFVAPIEKRRDGAAAARLRRLVAPFVLRRSKSDPSVIADLPSKIERTVVCSLTVEQAALYQAAVDRALASLAGAGAIQRRGRILALLTQLKQICNHPAQYLGESDARLVGRAGKLAVAQEIIGEATHAGDRLLVFTQFVAMGRLLAAQLSRDLDVDVPFLHGGVAAGGRDRMVERFQSDPDASPVLVVSLRAGGTGLNLTAATHVIHYDRWWNPAVEDQATDRAHRIGQTRTVEVHKLVTAGTLEERIAELLERKRALADLVVGAGEAWVTELDDDALADLVALSRDVEPIDLEDEDEEDLTIGVWSGSGPDAVRGLR
jgi:hypothetical protein